jgi:nicotinamidase-related amidase
MSQLELHTPENTAVVLIDHNLGTALSVQSMDRQALVSNTVALAKLAKGLNMPLVVTNGQDTDPSSILFPELTAVLGDTEVIARRGTFNAWDDADFVAAVERTGRRRLVLAGLWTEVCVMFPALSALRAGYEVSVVVDASAGESAQTQDAAIQRMVQAGVVPVTWFSLGAELTASWTNVDRAAVLGMAAAEHLMTFGLTSQYFAHTLSISTPAPTA